MLTSFGVISLILFLLQIRQYHTFCRISKAHTFIEWSSGGGRIQADLGGAGFPGFVDQQFDHLPGDATAAVFASFEKKPDLNEIKAIWHDFKGDPQIFRLPTAPKQFLNYFEENDQPQIKTSRDLEGGMAISIGRLRPDSQYDLKFVCMSHNTLRGAAGGAVLMAELLCAQGFIEK